MHYLVKEIEFIQQLESGLSFSSKIGRSKVDARLLKLTPKAFTYTFPNSERNPEVGKAMAIVPSRPRLHLKVTQAFLKHLKIDTFTHPASRPTTVFIHSFQSQSFQGREASFFKKVIPLPQAVSINNILTPTHGVTVDTKCEMHAYQVVVQKTAFTLLFEKYADRHYLVLECSSKVSFRTFDERCWAILVHHCFCFTFSYLF